MGETSVQDIPKLHRSHNKDVAAILRPHWSGPATYISNCCWTSCDAAVVPRCIGPAPLTTTQRLKRGKCLPPCGLFSSCIDPTPIHAQVQSLSVVGVVCLLNSLDNASTEGRWGGWGWGGGSVIIASITNAPEHKWKVLQLPPPPPPTPPRTTTAPPKWKNLHPYRIKSSSRCLRVLPVAYPPPPTWPSLK